MQKLNLPPGDFRLKQEEDVDYIFDIIRKKYVVNTPEEWVRQHFIHLLVNHLGYPKSMIRVEGGHAYFKSQKRSDVTVLNRNGEHFLLVECKSSDIKIDRKTLNQVSVYNRTLNARYVAISNGVKHFIWKYDGSGYEPLKEFPEYNQS